MRSDDEIVIGDYDLDKELAELDPQPDEEKDTRFADKLVKVFHRDGGEEWVLLHIEIQGDTSELQAFYAGSVYLGVPANAVDL